MSDILPRPFFDHRRWKRPSRYPLADLGARYDTDGTELSGQAVIDAASRMEPFEPIRQRGLIRLPGKRDTSA